MQNTENSKLQDEIHRLEIENAKALNELDYKKERIDELVRAQKEMQAELKQLNETVNKLYSRTIEQDSDLKQRIVAIESTLSTTRKIIAVTVPVLVTIIGWLVSKSI